jgi:hypothetical protein
MPDCNREMVKVAQMSASICAHFSQSGTRSERVESWASGSQQEIQGINKSKELINQ